MDYSMHVCEQCGHKVHPANDVMYHIGKHEFHFCNLTCKSDWLADNMHYEEPEVIEPRTDYIGHFNE